MKTPKSCSSCRYWLPRVSVDGIGACTAPLPISLSGFLIRQKDTFDDAGADCPAWRKRIVRKPKLVPVPAGVHKATLTVVEPEAHS
jgi:hypothetical protein